MTTLRRFSLRWILVHMLEETARHAGHADIIREQIDAPQGRFRRTPGRLRKPITAGGVAKGRA